MVWGYDFSGKVALVTGGASGIGRATARAFAEAGAWVAVADVNDDGGQRTVHMIREEGGEAMFFKCDFASPQNIAGTLADLRKHMGYLDFAFNNAGIEGETADTSQCSEANWQRVMDVNLRGVWLCMKSQIPLMTERGGGAIVNCSSIAGLVGFPGSPAYVASKHGVIGLTKTAALEFAAKKIRVNAVCPGVIKTPMVDRYTHGDAKAEGELSQSEPMGRMGAPDEVAAAVLWLCSEQSSFVTGHSLCVDGGWTAR